MIMATPIEPGAGSTHANAHPARLPVALALHLAMTNAVANVLLRSR